MTRLTAAFPARKSARTSACTAAQSGARSGANSGARYAARATARLAAALGAPVPAPFRAPARKSARTSACTAAQSGARSGARHAARATARLAAALGAPVPAPFRAPLALLLAAAMSLVLLLASPAAAFDTRARAAYVVDLTTGTVLLNKNADQPMPPASMSKLMTLYIAFEAIRDGRLSLSERLPVSSHAMSYGGSTMFLDTTDRVAVEDLLRGIIVLSGNDACAVIAEALSPDGTEAGFARFMTERARALGMENSTFANSNGWPAAGHRMSMRDLGILGTRLIQDFPQFYPMFAEREFKFDGRAPQNTRNRNPLLGLGIGADGLKTGHTEEAGYGLVGSAKQGERRILFVISGLGSSQARAEEAEAITNWAFRQFAQKRLLQAGQVIAQADVWMGAAPQVGLTVAEDLSTLMPVLAGNRIDAELSWNGPLQAPVTKGTPVGELILTPPGLPETRVPLITASDVAFGGFGVRVKTAAQKLIATLNQPPAAPTAPAPAPAQPAQDG